MRLINVTVPGSRRSTLLRAAAASWGGLAVVDVAWIDLLRGAVDLRALVRSGDVVRLDSPGKDFDTELELLRLGRASEPVGAAPSADDLSRLAFDRGAILWPATWYAGFNAILRRIDRQLAECSPHRRTATSGDIAIAFDKTQTQARLAAAGVTTPPALGRVGSFDELVDRCRERRWGQVFCKLAHGSSASGAVAIRIGRDRMLAWTTTEVDGHPSGATLYNTRAVRKLTSAASIRRVVDSLAKHALHAERWIPKAGVCGRAFDVRAVTIAAEPAHSIVRLSGTPMTNLHLLNDRADASVVRQQFGDPTWTAGVELARRGARAFPHSHCLGVDLMLDARGRRWFALEVNAFGDLLPGVMHDGQDVYAAQLASLFGPAPRATEAA